MSQNKYIVQIYRYFRGYENFTVFAENKAEAIDRAKLKAARYGNYDLNKVKVLKKLKE